MLHVNMAEVRMRLGKRAYNIAHITCNRYPLATQNKQGKSAIHASSLWSGDVQNGQVNGAASQQEVTVGVSLGCYTTVNSRLGNDLRERDTVAEVYRDVGLSKEGSLFTFTKDTNWTKKQFYARYRTTVTQDTVWAKPELQRPFCTSRFARRKESLVRRQLLLGQEQFLFIRCFSCAGDRSEPMYRSKTGYYDILQVLPNATQAQIKTAYYKQSFLYHPDKNAGSEEATTRFSDISEAYNVLGNKALRKKYDRGILNQADLTGAARPPAKDTGSSAKQQARYSVVGADGKSVFDFDKFIKAHYSEQLQRQRDIRVRKEEMLRKNKKTISEWKLGKMMEMAVAALLAMALAIMLSLKRGGN